MEQLIMILNLNAIHLEVLFFHLSSSTLFQEDFPLKTQTD